ncbi:MAG: 23S rRNA (adenine(2503)-C(2))-methyltransferase RlmN [Thermodesulfobacteriota bacterium]
MALNLFAHTCTELAAEFKRRYGKGRYHATGVYREVFRNGGFRLTEIPEFRSSPKLACDIIRDLAFPSCRILEVQEDAVLKFVSRLPDRNTIESVLIPAGKRSTLCVSSQVGCRMGCRFCATGGMGFVRDLTVEEIVWQVVAARFLLRQPVNNIVFMGMGEPLDNFENVLGAIEVISDQQGLDVPLRRITVSTAGHADGIRRLAARNKPNLRLAVSLNAAEDGLRDILMPINRKFPLEELRKTLVRFPLGRDSVLFIEYVLIRRINDSPRHAEELAALVDGLKVRVNLIAFNPSPGAVYSPPDMETVHRFQQQLVGKNIFTRLRRSYGNRIMAACGQLGAAHSVRAVKPLAGLLNG